MAKRIIIAGGGTGGHIFPALSIAAALRKLEPDLEFLFVGAKGKMEMEKVPEAGYKIIGLDITGLNRSSLIKNIGLPIKLARSFFQVRTIFKNFYPDAVIGVGGYSSFPVLRYAQRKRIPTFIHEPNSFAGKSNILLGKRAIKITVASDGMEKFFSADKIVYTGNPVRSGIAKSIVSKKEGLDFFRLDENKKTVLVIGGSLGAKSINEAISKKLDELSKAGLQLFWQTGKTTIEEFRKKAEGYKNIWIGAFITDMEKAYAAADIIVSRSGSTLYELCIVKKPVIFVPYPHASEDHQTANALNMVNKRAALMIKDNEANDKLVDTIIQLTKDEQQQNELKENIGKYAVVNADEMIAKEILKSIG